MFENVLKALDELSTTKKLTFQIERDEKGYIDRECPDQRCLFQFKVKPGTGSQKDDGLWMCPMCGHAASADTFHTTEQVEQARELAFAELQGTVNAAIRRDAEAFNRRQPTNAFLKMSMKVSGSSAYTHVDVPIGAKEAMQLEIHCDACNAEYAVIGAAFFCPLCGHSSAPRVFDDALRKISAKKDNAGAIKAAVTEVAGKDQAELVTRSVIESCLMDGVVAFQRFCEVTYRALPGTKELPSNAFQRLATGSHLWREALGEGYEEWSGGEAVSILSKLFQRRHLLAHSDGIVDEKYVTKSGDGSYRVGQRIIVSDADIDALVRILAELVAGIRRRVTTLHP